MQPAWQCPGRWAVRLCKFLLLVCVMALPLLGGCAQRMAVEGRSEQLYAEAKGALESEGFRPMGKASDAAGAKGSSLKEGRLQFLYYADNIAPTVVEVKIESAGPAVSADPGAENALAAAGAAGTGATSKSKSPVVEVKIESAGPAVSADPGAESAVAAAGAGGAGAGAAGAGAAGKPKSAETPHRVAVSAWSSLTYAPDPWITDLAVGVLRRAFLLSGNIR